MDFNSFWSEKVYGQVYLDRPADIEFEELDYEAEIEHDGIRYNVYYCERYGRYYGSKL